MAATWLPVTILITLTYLQPGDGFISSSEVGVPEIKGDRGFPGLAGPPGIPGIKGDKGERGDFGLTGVPGLPGIFGEQGERGLDGPPGLPGPKGEPGTARDSTTGTMGSPTIGINTSSFMMNYINNLNINNKGDRGSRDEENVQKDIDVNSSQIKGDKGEMGYFGKKGDKGDMGFTGVPGPRGYPGLNGFPGRDGPMGPPGSCAYIPEESFRNSIVENTDTFGTPDNPGKVSCKFAPNDLQFGNYIVYPPEPFSVTCNMESKTTCVAYGGELTQGNITSGSWMDGPESYWASTRGFKYQELYNMSRSQLIWLQKQSTRVKLTLDLYHKDFSSNNDVDGVLQFLTWNDQVIGSTPTKNSPFHYKITPSYGYLTDGGMVDEWTKSLINLESDVETRLPIIDFHISDMGQLEHSEFRLKLVDLCFG